VRGVARSHFTNRFRKHRAKRASRVLSRPRRLSLQRLAFPSVIAFFIAKVQAEITLGILADPVFGRCLGFKITDLFGHNSRPDDLDIPKPVRVPAGR